MKNETIEQIKEKLKKLDILNPPPIESINGYDIISLFNEMCALGFK